VTADDASDHPATDIQVHRIGADKPGRGKSQMPQHHFSTPKVVYLGLAYGEKPPRETRATSRTRPARSRAPRDRVALRRAEAGAPTTLR
jgi:hypothetical protein